MNRLIHYAQQIWCAVVGLRQFTRQWLDPDFIGKDADLVAADPEMDVRGDCGAAIIAGEIRLLPPKLLAVLEENDVWACIRAVRRG